MSKIKTAFRAWLCATALTLAASGPVFAEAYDIKLVRSLSVGNQSTITVDVSYNIARTGNSGPQTSDVSLHFVANRRIDGVDNRLGPTRATYTVDEFSSITDTKAVVVLQKGVVITATASDEGTSFDVDKSPASPGMTKALREVILMEPTDGSSTPDEIYGTRTARSVDESWSPRGDLISVIAKKHGFSVPADKITGGVKLVSWEKVDNIECLQIAGSVDADNIAPVDTTGVKFSKFHAHLDVTAYYPTEPTRDLVKSTTMMQFDKEFDVIGADGKPSAHWTETIKKQRDIKIAAVEK